VTLVSFLIMNEGDLGRGHVQIIFSSSENRRFFGKHMRKCPRCRPLQSEKVNPGCPCNQHQSQCLFCCYFVLFINVPCSFPSSFKSISFISFELGGRGSRRSRAEPSGAERSRAEHHETKRNAKREARKRRGATPTTLCFSGKISRASEIGDDCRIGRYGRRFGESQRPVYHSNQFCFCVNRIFGRLDPDRQMLF